MIDTAKKLVWRIIAVVISVDVPCHSLVDGPARPCDKAVAILNVHGHWTLA